MRRSEILFAMVILAVLLGSWALNGQVPSRSPGAAPAAAAPPAPLSEGWYCPVPTPQGLGATVETANLGAAPVTLRQTGLGTGSGMQVTATAGSLVSAPVATRGPQPAEVEAFGQHTVDFLSVLGTTVGAADERCTQQPAAEWLFAEASTAPGYDTYLYVANPFQEQAAVTVKVLGAGGETVPSGLGNYQIPPTSQTSLFLGDYYPETQSFGLDVTVNRGRVIVSRLMVVSQGGVRGLAMDVGQPSASTQWIFPGGSVPAQGQEEFLVANPTDHEALVDETFLTPGGGAPAGEQNLPVPAGQQVAIAASDQVPAGTAHGTILSSANGVPVVAERVTVQGSGNAQGFESVFGVPASGTTWTIPVGSAAGGTDTLGVVATGPAKASFGITLVTGTGSASPPALAGLVVDAGTRGSVDLTPYLGGQPALAVVHATSGSIAVENDDVLPPAYQETLESVGTPG